MKKASIFFLFSVVITLFYQCGSGEEKKEEEPKVKSEVSDVTQDPVS